MSAERPWMAPIYGPERIAELDDERRRYWLEDVERCEADVREAVGEYAWAAEVSARGGAPERAHELAAYHLMALDHAVCRLAACRSRRLEPGPLYRRTEAGLKHYAKATRAT